jgi:protein-disulfide isomerase
MHRLLGLLGLLFLVPLVTAAAPARDWSTIATQAPSGVYVIGNPAAKVKLVEWASYTCSHCADFAGQSAPVLKGQMIRSGSTSLELHHLVRDPLDLAAGLLARCAGPRGYTGLHAAIFAGQEAWMKHGVTYLQGNADRLEKLPRPAGLRQVADGAGLTAIARTRGVTEPQVAACFTQPAIDKLLALAVAPAEVTGTPTFYVNGKLVPNVGWAQLEPVLRAAGAK